MTLEQFEEKFRKNTRFDKVWYHGVCYVLIIFSCYMLYSSSVESNIHRNGNRTIEYFGFGFLILSGVYGLYVLKSTYKLYFWRNELTKEENIRILHCACSELMNCKFDLQDDNIHFIYRKSWWRMPYEIHLFADKNLIAINVEGVDFIDGGFVDFGASKRTRNKILDLLKEKASH